MTPVADGLPPLEGPPVARPIMVQRWSDIVFLHWRYEADEIQRLIPDGVEVDTIDGSAWVGLIPFEMRDLGVPGVAPLPLVGSFPEVNVRTYVRCGPHRGVWFFSLDIDRVAPALVARSAYHLPYCWGRVGHVRAGDVMATKVERRWPRGGNRPARTELSVELGPPVADDPVSRFLTSRWGLISATRRHRLRYAPVHHEPWPLHEATLRSLDDDLVTAAGLSAPQGPPHALWSPGVSVRVGRPRAVRSQR